MTARPMGLFRDMPFADYLAVDALSSTCMKLLAKSPWHYKNTPPMKQTRPMLRGSLAHCAQLEPDALATRYLIVPEDAPRTPTAAQWSAKAPNPSSKAAMDWWRDFNAQALGRDIVSADDYSITQQQLAAIKAEPYLSELFSHGDAECSVFWVDKRTGVYCKARPDFMQPVGSDCVRVAELKTTADESPDGFSRVLTNLGYHRARAHYVDGVQQATGKRVIEYVFAVVTSAEPVLAVPYWLDDEDAQQGEDECAELRDRFARCQRTGAWPAYGSGPQIVGLKKWAKRSSELEVSYVD